MISIGDSTGGVRRPPVLSPAEREVIAALSDVLWAHLGEHGCQPCLDEETQAAVGPLCFIHLHLRRAVFELQDELERRRSR